MKKKKKIKWWLVIVIFVFLGLVFGSDDGSTETTENTNQATETPVNEVEKETAKAPVEARKEDNVTMGQKNALKKAGDYLDYTAFSYKGLVEQLEYEGYTRNEAMYAADHCGADWNEQAAKKAQQYLDYSSFSKQGLMEQLEYEGFTQRQAMYAVQAVGY